MNVKEIALHYQAKIFENPQAAESAGWVLTEKLSPRNVWNKASAAQAIVAKLLARKKSGEAAEIGLVIESFSVSGCYLPNTTESLKTEASV